MKRQSYYFGTNESLANVCVDDMDIVVNCSGIENITKAFHTKGKRKDYYLMYILEGNIPIFINKSKQVLASGSFIIIEPNTVYSYSNNNNILNYYYVHFSGTQVNQILKRLNIPLNSVTGIDIKPKFNERFTKLFEEFIIHDENSLYMSGIILAEILVSISRSIKNHKRAIRLLNSIEYIHKHFSENITVKALADMEYLSVTHFRTVFKMHTGVSPSEYIIIQRINSACYYLTQTEASVAEIAGLVGYNDPFYFSRLFKKKMGITPKKYRKSTNTN